MTATATLYIGTYSVRGSLGLYQAEIDLATASMRLVAHAPADNASYLALSPDGRALYAAEETPRPVSPLMKSSRATLRACAPGCRFPAKRPATSPCRPITAGW